MKKYVVVDTNVLVSALITRNENAPTVKILRYLSQNKIVPVYSSDIVKEYYEVLRREKFKLSAEIVSAVIHDIVTNGLEVTDIVEVKEEMPDPKDVVFYAVTLTTKDKGTFLVTGNGKHFPAKPFIVTPAELVDILEKIMERKQLNHFDASGKAVMVDVAGKDETKRIAVTHGFISMSAEAFLAVREGSVKKGDVLGIARVAGIMAVKKTPELIPLCHTLQVTSAGIDFTLHEAECKIEAVCTVGATGRTGVEMEALTGVSAALLTIYDMCKALDRSMCISGIELLKKDGGKSGLYER